MLMPNTPLLLPFPPLAVSIASPTETISRSSRQKARQTKERAHTERLGAAAKYKKTVENVDTTSKITVITEPAAAPNTFTETLLHA